MFGRTKRQEGANAAFAAIPAVVPAVIPIPSRPLPQLNVRDNVVPLGAYQEIAKQLEFRPAALLKEEILRFLDEKQIPVFDYDEVDTYLRHHARQVKRHWIWRPLRECDKVDWDLPGPHDTDRHSSHGHGSYHPGNWSYRRYDKAIPLRVLRHVKQIQDKFGDEVSFFVTDYADPKPDPFIAVMALDVPPIVFGVWDEPGFGIERGDES